MKKIIILKNLQQILLILAILFIDFNSKKYISIHLSIGESIQLTKFVNFTYIKNLGFAFNILSDPEKYIYRSIILVMSIFFLLIFIKLQVKHKNYHSLSHSIIIGGSLGNIIDRIITGSVTDFISIHIDEYYLPIFNIADFSIFIGVISMIIRIKLK